MTDMTIETALREELHRIAPDIALEDFDCTQDLREEFDSDSMDLLTLVTALGKRFDLHCQRPVIRICEVLRRFGLSARPMRDLSAPRS